VSRDKSRQALPPPVATHVAPTEKPSPGSAPAASAQRPHRTILHTPPAQAFVGATSVATNSGKPFRTPVATHVAPTEKPSPGSAPAARAQRPHRTILHTPPAQAFVGATSVATNPGKPFRPPSRLTSLLQKSRRPVPRPPHARATPAPHDPAHAPRPSVCRSDVSRDKSRQALPPPVATHVAPTEKPSPGFAPAASAQRLHRTILHTPPARAFVGAT